MGIIDASVYPQKHVHPSHDLISLLHLDGLYNTYVRPFADNMGPDDDGRPVEDGAQVGQKRKRNKRAKIDKGYLHLIDDCIGENGPRATGLWLTLDPTPLGEKKDHMSIIPLIPDLLPTGHGQPPPDFGDRPQMLSADLFRNARLEAGQTVVGVCFDAERISKGADISMSLGTSSEWQQKKRNDK